MALAGMAASHCDLSARCQPINPGPKIALPTRPNGEDMLDAKLHTFIQGGVSILAASRSAGNAPCVSRATGCRVLPDGRLQIYLPTARSERLLEAIAASGAVAVVFSQPSSHKTIQVKASDAVVLDAARGDAAQLATYCDAFSAQLEGLGYGTAMAHALVQVSADDVSCVAFTPTSVFNQTPGPRAGEPLAQSS